MWQQGATTQSFLYHADTGTATNLTALPGGAGLIGTALNNLGQVVGNGYIYNDGTVQRSQAFYQSAAAGPTSTPRGLMTVARSSDKVPSMGSRWPSS